MGHLQLVPCNSVGLLALTACALVSGADLPVSHVVGFDTTVLEEEYCARPVSGDGGGSAGDMNTATMSCSKLMEFVYVSRLKVKEKLETLLAAAKANEAEPAEWTSVVRKVSRGQSFLSAHMHVIAALATQRPGCFSENMRLLLTMALRRLKPLVTGQLEALWLVTQSGPDQASTVADRGRAWLSEAAGLVDADLRTLKSVLATWSEPTEDEARFFSHEADGRYSTLEALRRDTFDEFVLDRGVLRALLRHVLQTGATVADIGAGSGHYAKWLNDTGLVSAYAFDGTPEVELVTRGAVLGIDLGRPLELWQKFDWVICLEVATSIPPELTPMFLQNLDRHAGEGLILSWTQPGLRALGSPNPRSQAEVLALVKEHTGLHLSEELTAQLRAASAVPSLADSLLVLTRTTAPVVADDGTGASGAVTSGCTAEDGWIYSGNDLQMFSGVPSAAACCELCSTNAQCRFWTWSREESHKMMCWIKGTREYRINHDGFVSGESKAAA
jgi:uncharacterized protein YfcZ (UPF0381/DUF406 family)